MTNPNSDNDAQAAETPITDRLRSLDPSDVFTYERHDPETGALVQVGQIPIGLDAHCAADLIEQLQMEVAMLRDPEHWGNKAVAALRAAPVGDAAPDDVLRQSCGQDCIFARQQVSAGTRQTLSVYEDGGICIQEDGRGPVRAWTRKQVFMLEPEDARILAGVIAQPSGDAQALHLLKRLESKYAVGPTYRLYPEEHAALCAHLRTQIDYKQKYEESSREWADMHAAAIGERNVLAEQLEAAQARVAELERGQGR